MKAYQRHIALLLILTVMSIFVAGIVSAVTPTCVTSCDSPSTVSKSTALVCNATVTFPAGSAYNATNISVTIKSNNRVLGNITAKIVKQQSGVRDWINGSKNSGGTGLNISINNANVIGWVDADDYVAQITIRNWSTALSATPNAVVCTATSANNIKDTGKPTCTIAAPSDIANDKTYAPGDTWTISSANGSKWADVYFGNNKFSMDKATLWNASSTITYTWSQINRPAEGVYDVYAKVSDGTNNTDCTTYTNIEIDDEGGPAKNLFIADQLGKINLGGEDKGTKAIPPVVIIIVIAIIVYNLFFKGKKKK